MIHRAESIGELTPNVSSTKRNVEAGEDHSPLLRTPPRDANNKARSFRVMEYRYRGSCATIDDYYHQNVNSVTSRTSDFHLRSPNTVVRIDFHLRSVHPATRMRNVRVN